MRIWKASILLIAVAGIGSFTYLRAAPDLLAGLFGEPAKAAVEQPPMPAMPVPVSSVVKKTIPIYLDYAARTEAIRSIDLQAKVSGYVLDQSAADGADVKTGDLLYRIDPRDYRAVLDQITAQTRRDQASLDYAKANLDRGSDLTKTGFLSKDSYQQRASLVAQGEATVNAGKAAIESARINLGYTEIRAPFDGRLGRNQAPAGTLVSTTSSTTLNTLVQISPLYVTFTPSETDLALIRKARSTGSVSAEVAVPGDGEPPRKGELTFIDNAVDHTTGTIIARATIANADRALLPGQYVNIRLLVGEQPDALMVPQVALGSGQMGKYVYVVDQGKVGMRLVELGQTQGELVSVTKGIKADDQVISGNLQKIGPGMPVTPMPAKTASASKS
jgi:membrane fusion protein, multidrug efflux system